MFVFGLFCYTLLSPSQSIEVMVKASEQALNLCLQLCAIYALWLGVLEVMQQSGIDEVLFHLFSPITKKLFSQSSSKAQKLITTNLVANFLGLGNAATPSGIDAMQAMDNKTKSANKEMILFMVLNATAVQLYPTTVVSLRASMGSLQPANIFFPTLFSSLIATLVGILLCYACSKFFFKEKR